MVVQYVGMVSEWNVNAKGAFEEICKGLKQANSECGYYFGIIEKFIDKGSYVLLKCKHGRNGFVTHRSEYRLEKE